MRQVQEQEHGRFIRDTAESFYENKRPDLDNCLKVVLDCLQECKAIKNDRDCVKVVAEKFIDKMNPRIEFELNWV